MNTLTTTITIKLNDVEHDVSVTIPYEIVHRRASRGQHFGTPSYEDICMVDYVLSDIDYKFLRNVESYNYNEITDKLVKETVSRLIAEGYINV